MKQKIGNYILNRKLNRLKRKREICNLDLAKSVGIIFNATNQKSYERASRFANFLMTKDIHILALGYVENKEMLKFYADKRGFKFFSRKNINWWGKPKNPSIDYFIEREFDILIDLSLESFFPIEYIVALSLAKLKVGRHLTEPNYFDIMIDISKERTLDNLINQVELYLSIMNVNSYSR